ncbi:TNF receptor-associated factor 6 [Merluccius polli]|uniref:TNF receptor-associated factor n=1 Tax=Merluccius polli TaxID=89951 RepID=A0AA47MS62_MERPO|nr:TNF receptor-associated factor 6 [Merluccius polli]
MAYYDGEKDSLDTDAGCGGELSSCAAAMLEKERESLLLLSPSSSSESPSAAMAASLLQAAATPQGYDVEFDPPLESKYECPVCLMALRNAIQTPCGHRFCKHCIEKSIRDTGQRCPVDNEMLLEEQLFPDNFAKREILSLTVRCPNAGCKDKMELRHLESHVSQCPFATVPCSHCQQSVLKSHFEEHTTLECHRRLVTCPDCVASFVYEEQQLHVLQCPFANVNCQYCGLELIRDQMESHCDTDCPKAPIACTFHTFGCPERMQRHNLAQHMQEFTQMHMRYMAEFVRSMSLGESTPKSLWTLSSEDQGAAASVGPSTGPCGPRGQSVWSGSGGAGGGSGVSCQSSEVSQMLREMDGRLVTQDHQLRELIIGKETQGVQLAELRRRISALEETVKELEAQQSQGVFVWRLRGFSALLRNQEMGLPVVEHSPGFYTGRPGYKLCLRLHLQAPNAPRCSNFISLFVHTMQGPYDGQLSWPFQGTIRLAVLDQGSEGQHHMEVMETKPDLQAFQRPAIQRNPKGFGYVTFLHLHQLQQRAFVRDDTLMVRCEVTPRFDAALRREGVAVAPRGPEDT